MRKKNVFEPRAVTGRRGGPAKAPLSRDVIVDTALELLRQQGLEAMTLRRVAAMLDTGPASLYVYVEDLRELEALVIDRALASVRLPSKRDAPWRDRLIVLLNSYLRVLHENTGLARLAMRTIAAGPHALRIFETMLGLLDEAGVDGPTAAWAVDMLTMYVTATAAEQSDRQAREETLGRLTLAIGAVSASDYPRIHGLREDLLSGGRERVEWAFDVLLKGILQTPRAVPGTSRPRKG